MQTISHDQRSLIFVLIAELAYFIGYTDKKKKQSSKLIDQLKDIYYNTYDEPISLKDGCTLESYEKYKDMIMEYALELGCTFEKNAMNYYSEDIERYLVMCIKLRICCITGKPNADIHHTKALGKGVNRDEVDHSKYPRMSLSREKHQLAHQKGQEWFDKEYHVHGVYCNYHNKSDYEGGIESQTHGQVKGWKYSRVNELLGVKFIDDSLVYYKMTEAEHDAMMMAENSGKHFYKNVYGTFEEIEL